MNRGRALRHGTAQKDRIWYPVFDAINIKVYCARLLKTVGEGMNNQSDELDTKIANNSINSTSNDRDAEA